MLLFTRRLTLACLGSRVRRELATAEGTIGSSPTSSRWALETLATRARLGDGRRLSGEHCGGCGTLGEETVREPPQSVLLNTGPRSTGTQYRKGVYNMFMRVAIGNCHARVDTDARRLIGSIEAPAVSRTTRGPRGQAQLSCTHRSGGGIHLDHRTRQT